MLCSAMTPSEYLALGWHLLPIFEISGGSCSCGNAACDSPGKHPRAGLGLKHASTKPEDLEVWIRQWPSMNMAAACRKSGFVAVDVDPRAGGNETFKALLKQLGPLPDGPVQKTGGDGRHYLLTVPPKTKLKGKLGHGVDLKANGYILIAPSNHISGGSYSWLVDPDITIPAMPPQWLEAAEKPKPPKHKPDLRLITGRDTTQYGSAALEDEAERLRNAREGERNNTLNRVAFSLGQLVAGGEIQSHDAEQVRAVAVGIGLSEAEVDKAWCSGYSAGQSEPRQADRTQRPRDNPPPHTDADAPLDISARHPGNWQHHLVWDTNTQNVTKDPGNAVLILTNHEQWRDVLRYNEFRRRIEWTGSPPEVPGFKTPTGDFRDHHIAHPMHWLRLHYGGKFTKDSMFMAVENAARASTIHPVKDYLGRLSWDGKQRVSGWLTDYLDADDTPATRSMGIMWLISAVARIYRPGCQADHVLILEGPQGVGKSTTLRTLGGKWFQGELGNIASGEAVNNIQGYWIVEIAELDSFKGAASTRIKSFLTQTMDSYRPKYGRIVIDRPRQCVAAGTTNEGNYLHDSTGGRRFWPVRVKHLHRQRLKDDRDQLWAEAAELYQQGIKWWPDDEKQTEMLAEVQEDRFNIDPWEPIIDDFLKSRLLQDGCSIDEILGHLDIEKNRWDKALYMRVGQIMRHLKWTRKRVKVGHIRIYKYIPPL